jgi:asparagine synthase (glutamine-hydrolysing)
VAEIADRLRQAVRDQLVGEVPLGAMVSGGLDSSSVALLADDEPRGGELHLFAFHDAQAEADERPYQRAVLTSMRGRHRVHWVSASPAELARELDRYLDHQEEPYGDASSYAEMCIARTAAQVGVKVLLSGLGGDEVFVGYPAFFGPLVLDALAARDLDALRTLLRVAQKVAPETRPGMPLAAALYHALPSPLRNAVTAWRSARALHLSAPSTARATAEAWSRWHRHPGRGATNAALRGAIESWSIPRYLSHSDRMTLAFGVEGRVPLLDHRLMQAAFALPPSLRVDHRGLKAGLRNALGERLPAAVANRAWKLGFHTPLGPYVRAIEDALREGHRRASQLLDERGDWSTLDLGARWRWGMAGAYASWVASQPVGGVA